MAKLPIILILDNIRSAHNVGSIWRTADAAGVEKLILVGITPHPGIPNDDRLPYVVQKAERDIAKTALGAEKNVPFEHFADLDEAIAKLRSKGYQIVALELSPDATSIFDYHPTNPVALMVGSETDGLSPPTLKLADKTIMIPMSGLKESLNVAVAAGIAVYFLKFNYKNNPLL